MEMKLTTRFTLGRQSSLALKRTSTDDDRGLVEVEEEDIDLDMRLMYLASEGDLEGMGELLDSGVNANFCDIDDRTALHVAACQRFIQVVQLLLDTGVDVDSKDRWGSTPIANSIYYKNHDVIKLLEKHGVKTLMVPMSVNHVRHIPKYEIDPREIDFTNSVDIDKGTFRKEKWRGIQVAVKKLEEEVTSDQDKRAFIDELSLISILIDIIFMLQHYVIYPPKKKHVDKDGSVEPLINPSDQSATGNV